MAGQTDENSSRMRFFSRCREGEGLYLFIKKNLFFVSLGGCNKTFAKQVYTYKEFCFYAAKSE